MEDMAALWYPGQGPVVRCRCGPALPSYAARRTASPEVHLLRPKCTYCRLFVPHCGHCPLFGQTVYRQRLIALQRRTMPKVAPAEGAAEPPAEEKKASLAQASAAGGERAPGARCPSATFPHSHRAPHVQKLSERTEACLAYIACQARACRRNSLDTLTDSATRRVLVYARVSARLSSRAEPILGGLRVCNIRPSTAGAHQHRICVGRWPVFVFVSVSVLASSFERVRKGRTRAGARRPARSTAAT